jgi:hypothetical protein
MNLGHLERYFSHLIERTSSISKPHQLFLAWILYITMNHDQESNAAIELVNLEDNSILLNYKLTPWRSQQRQLP